MSHNMSAEQFAALFDQLLRDMPEKTTLHHDLPQNTEWLGRAAALVNLADPLRGVIFRGEIDRLYGLASMPADARQRIIVTVQQFAFENRMKAGGPLCVAFAPGQVFDYFDEVRKILETATSEVFVVDPYMGAEFIARYLPHIKPGVQIRLLAQQKITAVQAAVEQFVLQYGARIELRKSIDLHDRYVFVDRNTGYHSGATFKDGAMKSPTTLTQIVDSFPQVFKLYDDAWNASKTPSPLAP